MGKPLVIFDFDGVIVDSVKLLESEIRKKLHELGYDFMETRQETLDLFEENIVVALIDHGLTPHHMCEVWEHIQGITKSNDIKLCSGMGDLLEGLKDKCDMAIVSSNATDSIEESLDRLGVKSYFFRISGGDQAMGKVVRIKKCMEDMGVKPSRTFYVGDTVGDVHEAKEAGVGSIAVIWGMHPPDRLASASPDIVVKDSSELFDLIDAFADEESSED